MMGIKKEKIFYSSKDNKNTIHATLWYGESPKAVVQIVHGVAEHIGRYDEFAEYLCSRGFAVVGEDHLGHGETVSNYEDICFFAEENGWQTVCQDILQLTKTAKERFSGLPYFLLGHSMGSFLSRTIVLDHSDEFDGLLLSGTGHQNGLIIAGGTLFAKIVSHFKGPKSKSVFINAIAFGSYNKKFEPNRTRFDWLSACEDVVDKYLADEKCGNMTSTGLFIDMLKGFSLIKNKKLLSKIRKDLPIYIYSGTDDPVGDMGKGVKTVFSLYKEAGVLDVTLQLYEGYRHEMHNEENKLEVMQNVADWIESKLQI